MARALSLSLVSPPGREEEGLRINSPTKSRITGKTGVKEVEMILCVRPGKAALLSLEEGGAAAADARRPTNLLRTKKTEKKNRTNKMKK